MAPLSFKRHRFPPTIIRHCVWLYARFTLSYRDIEEMLAERGVGISIGNRLSKPDSISLVRSIFDNVTMPIESK
jgi:hypothetical protein